MQFEEMKARGPRGSDKKGPGRNRGPIDLK